MVYLSVSYVVSCMHKRDCPTRRQFVRIGMGAELLGENNKGALIGARC